MRRNMWRRRFRESGGYTMSPEQELIADLAQMTCRERVPFGWNEQDWHTKTVLDARARILRYFNQTGQALIPARIVGQTSRSWWQRLVPLRHS
jgi:hypothetical protein